MRPCGAGVALPSSVSDCGLPGAEWAMASEELRVPAAAGAKRITSVQLVLAPSTRPEVQPLLASSA